MKITKMRGLYVGQTVLVDGSSREIEMLDLEADGGKGAIRFKDSMFGHHDECFCDLEIEEYVDTDSILQQQHLEDIVRQNEMEDKINSIDLKFGQVYMSSDNYYCIIFKGNLGCTCTRYNKKDFIEDEVFLPFNWFKNSNLVRGSSIVDEIKKAHEDKISKLKLQNESNQKEIKRLEESMKRFQ